MKRQNLIVLIAVAIVSAILSITASNAIFGTPQSRPIKIPVVNNISSSFPDVHNDTNYNVFLNSQALDPTQLIRIAPNNNATPFQGGSGQ